MIGRLGRLFSIGVDPKPLPLGTLGTLHPLCDPSQGKLKRPYTVEGDHNRREASQASQAAGPLRRRAVPETKTNREPIGLAQKLAERVKPDGSVVQSACPICGQAVLYIRAHGRRTIHDLDGCPHPCVAPPIAEDAGQMRMTQ